MNAIIDMLIIVTMIGVIGTVIGLAMKIVEFFYGLVQRNRG